MFKKSRHFLKYVYIFIANKSMKRCSTPLVIWDMQINTTMSDYFILSGATVAIKVNDNNW